MRWLNIQIFPAISCAVVISLADTTRAIFSYSSGVTFLGLPEPTCLITSPVSRCRVCHKNTVPTAIPNQSLITDFPSFE